eukprot:GCRY01000473.1.p1 GENE.GCRY01000473.1~~GCRY01000473.1.p1  ORF type:complete len:220 (+),score=49.85 GCRY01000473.1:159-818(+)
MNDQEVKLQIKQMVSFIKQEAHEKADEVMVKAEEEFNIEKTRIVQDSSSKLQEEFELKKKEIENRKRITHSLAVKDSRLKILEEEERLLRKVFKETSKQLQTVSESAEYDELLVGLIVQGLEKIDEKEIEIQCRECDKAKVEKALLKATAQFKKNHFDVSATISSNYLPPPPSKQNKHGCAGGVILSALRGGIKCNNTLEARFAIACHDLLPQVKNTLF